MASARRQRRVTEFERNGCRSFGGKPSVATGFAWRADNIGGVRRHLECLQEYSTLPVAVYPSTYASTLLQPNEKDQYHRSLSYETLSQHALVHSHVDPHFIESCKQASAAGKPWVHTYHALYFEEDWGGQLQPWQTEINNALIHEASKADFCIAVGSWLVELLWDKYQIHATYIPNGVDVTACDQARPERFNEKFGLSDFVLCVGSILGVKNPISFIRLAESMPEQQFVMIGSGLTKEFIEKLLSVKVPKNLMALGPLPYDLTLDTMAACDAFVMTSRREGQPTVLLEAMALRRPCVVPTVQGFADAIADPSHGFTFELDELDSLRAAVQRALQEKQMPHARQHVLQNFSWKVVMRKIDSVYSALLKDRTSLKVSG